MEIDKQVRQFFDDEFKLKAWPGKYGKQVICLKLIVEHFEHDKEYDSTQIKDILNQAHTFSDPALLRRELVSSKLLDRTPDGKTYWRVK
jgi:hypothetical protein